jgi:hypothetical protein
MAPAGSLRAAHAWIESRCESMWSDWHRRYPVHVIVFSLAALSLLAWPPDPLPTATTKV